MRFTKMHGIGNDYVYVDCTRGDLSDVEDPAALSVRISRPHVGIGSDGLVLILPSSRADFAMRIFNADGSEAEMCGNAVRCVGKYVYDRGLTTATQLTLDTKGGIRRLWLTVAQGAVQSVRVDMGAPDFRPAAVGSTLPGGEALNIPIDVADTTWAATLVSLGNPHCVVFMDRDPAGLDLPAIGPLFEKHPLFPHRINTEFAQVLAPDAIRMRVWERGSGETLACGTGACAVLAAAARTGRSHREATVHLLGGDLRIAWEPDSNILYKTGPAAFVFDGDWWPQT